MENILAECNSRREVNTRMTDCRVYVGTVASIAAKAELFKLKRFDVAIVDEATQILEPNCWVFCVPSLPMKEMQSVNLF